MEDKELMEEHLLTLKGICDLYMHGTLESTTKEVHDEFKCALNDSLNIQNKVYNLMASKGWYKAEEAQQNQISQTKQKFE